jgi:uncharacterized protein
MHCPVDGATLLLSDRQGVEIDYCPQCRGVWLDRGELDKLIQRNDDEGRDYDRGRDRHQEYTSPRPPKKKRLLSEIFDFD